MIYFLVTTSLFDDSEIRQQQYRTAITALKTMIETLEIAPSRIIIIENNGRRSTMLDTLGCDILYTNNNHYVRLEKGYKELLDVRECISHYNIQDSDFIVKMTGRYILEETSEFMQAVKELPVKNWDCIIKFGSYSRPVDHQVEDCITGLIGMRCQFVKRIETPRMNECIEWKWAKATYLIDNDKIHKVGRLGIRICPGSNTYFSV
jgi:hypothetical protein